MLFSEFGHLTIMLLMIVLFVCTALQNQEASEMAPYTVYIVEFKDEPLASYRGGLADYPPTSPSLTGRKLDFKRSDVVRYRKHLERQQLAYLKAIKSRLKREPEVLQSYDVGFFGITVLLKDQEAAAIRKLPGIKQIRPDEFRTLRKGSGSKK